MKKIAFVSVLIMILTGCFTGMNKRIFFVHYASNQNQQKKIRYSLRIPSGFIFDRIASGGEAGSEVLYRYPDASLIYISDFGNSPNDSLISLSGFKNTKYHFLLGQDALRGDTLILTGMIDSVFCWREITIGKVSFGYKNVPIEKKEIFDGVLCSIRKK